MRPSLVVVNTYDEDQFENPVCERNTFGVFDGSEHGEKVKPDKVQNSVERDLGNLVSKGRERLLQS
jgi:hypothetical protein